MTQLSACRPARRRPTPARAGTSTGTSTRASARTLAGPLAGALAGLLTGCASLLPPATPAPAFYALDDGAAPQAAGQAGAPLAAAAGLTLVVQAPQAQAGFDSPRMVYQRQPLRLEQFAHSRWVDTPARMLAPLLARAVVQGGAISAAVPPTTAATGDLRLVTQVVRLQQDFGSGPSQVRFTLQATVLDESTHRVIASTEFDQRVAAAADDPAGGALAAHQAVQSTLRQLGRFCEQAALQWQADGRH